MTKNILLDANEIRDWDSFHTLFSKAFGYPSFYGRNMDAWIDCMSSLDTPEEGMTSVHLARGEVAVLCISSVASLKNRCPDIYEALIECTAFVNFRRIERGEPAVLALAFSI